MFVTVKVEEDQGNIVQIIVVDVPPNVREERRCNLSKIAKPMIICFYEDSLMEKGYPDDTVFPEWKDNEHKLIMHSR